MKKIIKIWFILIFLANEMLGQTDTRYNAYYYIETMTSNAYEQFNNDGTRSFKNSNSQLAVKFDSLSSIYTGPDAITGSNSGYIVNNCEYYESETKGGTIYNTLTYNSCINIGTTIINSYKNGGIYTFDYTYYPSFFLALDGECYAIKELKGKTGIPHRFRYPDLTNPSEINCPKGGGYNYEFDATLAMVTFEKQFPILTSPSESDPLSIITLEAPEFMSKYFDSKDIIWLKSNSSISKERGVEAGMLGIASRGIPIKGDTVGYGTRLTVKYNPSDPYFSNPCGVRSYYAYVPKFNWLSRAIYIRFSPNLQLGTDLIVNQPACHVDQIAGNASLALGNVKINTTNRQFNVIVDGNTRPTFNSGENIPLAVGTHTLEFREFFTTEQYNSCPQTLSVTITAPPKLDYTAGTLSSINCFGGKASYALKVKGGTLPKDTLILDATTKYVADTGTTTSITNIAKGSHTLTLKDGKGCIHQTPITFTVTEPPQLLLSATASQPQCFGDKGIITLTATGGTPVYSYLFNGQTQPTNTLVANAGATISLSVTDNKGCNANSTSVTIDTPTDFNLAVQSTKANRCANETKGEVRLLASSSNTSYTYTYSKDGSNYVSSNVITGLPSGTVTLFAKNNKGCIKQVTTNIAAPVAINLVLGTKQDATCLGDNNGSMSIQVSGGAGVKSLWLNNEPPIKPSSNGNSYTKVFTGLVAGTYTVHAQDDSLCENTANFSIATLSNIVNGISKTAPSCKATNNGQITITPTGGRTPYTYKWISQVNLPNTASISNLAEGNYTVTVTDLLGCTKTESVELIAPKGLTVNLGNDATLCKNQTRELDAQNPGNNYIWGSDNGFTATTQKVTIRTAGTYYVNVTSTLGCPGYDTIKIAQSSRSFEAEFLIATQAIVNDTVIAVVNNTNVADLTLFWQLPTTAGKQITAPQLPVQQFVFDKAGTYPVSLKAQYLECEASALKYITLYDSPKRDSIEAVLGIESEIFKEVSAFPNPNNGTFTLKVVLDSERAMDIKLMSMATGALVQSVSMPVAKIQIKEFEQALAEGLYVIYLNVNDKTSAIRLFVAGD